MTLNISESRPYLDGFRAFYEDQIGPWIGSVREQHRKYRKKVGWLAMLTTVAGVAVIALNANTGIDLVDQLPPILNIPLIVGGAATGYLAYLAFTSLANADKEIQSVLSTKIATFFGFSHDPTGLDFPYSQFFEVNLIPYYDRWENKDRIAGTYQGVAFSSSELKLTRSRGDITEIVFQGILLTCRFHKSFSSKTLIKSDGGTIGNLFPPRQGVERVRLEDLGFEQQFVVYGTDQVEARYLLTPTFMERLSSLAFAFDEGALEAGFLNGELLLAFNLGHDPFGNLDSLMPVDHPGQVEQLFTKFGFAPNVIDALRLTSRSNA